ncbi:mycofactocin precursor MftA [Streptomyces yangpuensis]
MAGQVAEERTDAAAGSGETAGAAETVEAAGTVEDLLVEDVSIDGMCGVY